MKCHYEVLNVSENVSNDDLKKAYRKLALKWHPDKNPDNIEHAKEQFQLVQQAYDVLSDPQERSWYDKHKDSILKGGLGDNYKDDSINVYQYFTTSCYKGYGDDANSFYSVYREVFKNIAAEDSEFDKADTSSPVPEFGDSKSPYEEVVHPFYSYWQSYSTKKTYSWLDMYDVRSATNRRVFRAMEKENKKIRDKARKERNEEVRALVGFVRKRDKRVQAYATFLEQKAADNLKKMEDKRRKQLLERQREMLHHTESEWSKFSNLEDELKEIEANLAAEFKDNISEDGLSEDSSVNTNPLYCVACNKIFKTEKTFLNHEKSKKHKDNVAALKVEVNSESGDSINDDPVNPAQLNSVSSGEDGDCSSFSVDDYLSTTKKNRKTEKKFCQANSVSSSESESFETFMNTPPVKHKKEKKKSSKPVPVVCNSISENLPKSNKSKGKKKTQNRK